MYLLNKGQGKSISHNLNILYNESNVYIMDNHLAALWCWYQKINFSKKYYLIHIDRHTDLSNALVEPGVNQLVNSKQSIVDMDIEEFTNYEVTINEENYQLFIWDNYIEIFCRLNPKLIEKFIFSTQQEISNLGKKYIAINNWNLSDSLQNCFEEGKKRWIVNLDIDYFFNKYTDLHENGVICQYLSDEYIASVCDKIKNFLSSNIEVLTIAMSPDCCGGWENSIRVTNLVSQNLGLQFRM